MSEVRVRFAPSPTGYLHIGGVRTALYSWLWARQHGGTFILRIEDTDRERSTEESIQIVLESMRWLGLDWDEGPEVGGDHGPYVQSERLDIYADYAETLIRSGHAYRCYATKEEIAAAREAHQKSGTKDGFRFQSPWRDRTDAPEDPNARHVIRFRAPHEGTTSWVDEVKGKIDILNSTQQDFILLRPDGMPLYNFGCVVDDLTMGVTLVARGDDHMINTAPQILLYEALGAPVPSSHTCRWCSRPTARSSRSATPRSAFSSIATWATSRRGPQLLGATRLVARRSGDLHAPGAHREVQLGPRRLDRRPLRREEVPSRAGGAPSDAIRRGDRALDGSLSREIGIEVGPTTRFS